MRAAKAALKWWWMYRAWQSPFLQPAAEAVGLLATLFSFHELRAYFFLLRKHFCVALQDVAAGLAGCSSRADESRWHQQEPDAWLGRRCWQSGEVGAACAGTKEKEEKWRNKQPVSCANTTRGNWCKCLSKKLLGFGKGMRIFSLSSIKDLGFAQGWSSGSGDAAQLRSPAHPSWQPAAL